jgi:16S rRNA (guanine527-N7)-methyltransferase
MTPELEIELRQLIERLLDANTRVNLTAIRTPEEAWIKHILDSLEGLQTRLFVGEKTAIDVGSGPGFPGLPLALAKREVSWSFLDATRKKCDFVRETSQSFGLKTKIIHGRAEEIGHKPEFRAQFDIATARAVGNIVEVAEYCLPLVKPRGHVILWRGKDAETEAKQQKWPLSKLGGVVREIRPYELEGHEMTYHLVVLEKASPTPKDFPRAVGVPKASPLK